MKVVEVGDAVGRNMVLGGGQLQFDTSPRRVRVNAATTTAPMRSQITQRELRNSSGEVMRGLDQGESFVVTRNGVPVGELTPLRHRRFVSAEAAVAAFNGAPRVDLDRLRADLDRVASQETTPRG